MWPQVTCLASTCQSEAVPWEKGGRFSERRSKELPLIWIQVLLPCSNSQSENLNPHQRESSQFHRQQEHPFSWFMHRHGEHDSCHGSDDSRSMNTQPTLQSWPSRIAESTLCFRSLGLKASVNNFPVRLSSYNLNSNNKLDWFPDERFAYASIVLDNWLCSCLSRDFNVITMLLLSINYIIGFNQSSAKIRNACQYEQWIENWMWKGIRLFYIRQLKSNFIMITQCQKVNFRVFCSERGIYMNVFLWLLDFVTPSNNFSFEVLVFWYIIIQLSLSDSSSLSSYNSVPTLRSLSIRQYTIHLWEKIVEYM